MSSRTNPVYRGQVEPLPKGRIVAFGFGDFGFNLFYTGLNLYLLYYYTDVLRIAPATAGLIFMLPVIWDAVTDPVMGAIASRTRSRWGKYRPYILFGGPIMALSFVGMFAAPLLFSGAVVAASLVSHILFRTAYTVVSIPYSTLMATMTSDGSERASLAGARMVCAVAGGVLTAFATLELAKGLGDGDLAQGFVWTACVFAALATLIMLILFATTRETLDPTRDTAQPSARDTLRYLKRNTAFWIVFVAVFFGALGSSIGSKALVYYVTYVVSRPDGVSGLLSASLLITGASVPLWAWLAHRWSKRDLWVAGGIGSMICNAVLLILAPEDYAVLFALICLAGFYNGAFITMFWAMLPDTVEFGQWRSGVRDEGIVFGLNQLALKAASGIGVGMLGVLLGTIGYETGVAQSAETLFGLKWLAFGIPLAAAIAAVLTISRSPLTKKRHEILVRYLSRKT